MKEIKLPLTLILISIFNFTFGQQPDIPDSVYLYQENAQKEWFYVQKDVFCFNLIDNSNYNGYLPGFVDTIFSYSNSYSNFNAVYFSSSSTITERLGFENYIKNLDGFKSIAWTISRTQNEYQGYNFYLTDDVIMVTFNDPLLQLSEIDSFASKYGLELVYQPPSSLPNEVSWTYSFILKNHPNNKNLTTIKLAQEINEQEDTLVMLADPNVFSVELLSLDVSVDKLSNSFDIEGLIIFPNPFSNSINVQIPNIPEQNILDVKIYDLVGRLIYSFQYENKKVIQINSLGWAEGVYNCVFNVNNQYLTTKKIIKGAN